MSVWYNREWSQRKPENGRKNKPDRHKEENGSAKMKQFTYEASNIKLASSQNTKSLINFDNNRCVFLYFPPFRWDIRLFSENYSVAPRFLCFASLLVLLFLATLTPLTELMHSFQTELFSIRKEVNFIFFLFIHLRFTLRRFSEPYFSLCPYSEWVNDCSSRFRWFNWPPGIRWMISVVGEDLRASFWGEWEFLLEDHRGLGRFLAINYCNVISRRRALSLRKFQIYHAVAVGIQINSISAHLIFIHNLTCLFGVNEFGEWVTRRNGWFTQQEFEILLNQRKMLENRFQSVRSFCFPSIENLRNLISIFNVADVSIQTQAARNCYMKSL